MLNLFQHLFKFRRLTASSSASLRLRVKPAMTRALQKGFLEVPSFLSFLHFSACLQYKIAFPRFIFCIFACRMKYCIHA